MGVKGAAAATAISQFLQVRAFMYVPLDENRAGKIVW